MTVLSGTGDMSRYEVIGALPLGLPQVGDAGNKRKRNKKEIAYRRKSLGESSPGLKRG